MFGCVLVVVVLSVFVVCLFVLSLHRFVLYVVFVLLWYCVAMLCVR